MNKKRTITNSVRDIKMVVGKPSDLSASPITFYDADIEYNKGIIIKSVKRKGM